MKEFVKKTLKGCWLGRIVYEPIHRLYQLYSIPHRRRMLRRHGREVLAHLADVVERRGLPVFAAYGTLLGFVREHGFLASDDDIDLGVLPGEWTPRRLLKLLLEEEGFDFLFAFSYDGAITEFKVAWHGVPVDFFFYQDDGEKFYAGSYHYLPGVDYPSPNANSAQRVVEPRIESLETREVFGLRFPVPAYPEQVLEQLYGDWRTPDSHWDDSKHPGIEDLPVFAFSLTKEEALK